MEILESRRLIAGNSGLCKILAIGHKPGDSLLCINKRAPNNNTYERAMQSCSLCSEKSLILSRSLLLFLLREADILQSLSFSKPHLEINNGTESLEKRKTPTKSPSTPKRMYVAHIYHPNFNSNCKLIFHTK